MFEIMGGNKWYVVWAILLAMMISTGQTYNKRVGKPATLQEQREACK